MPTLLEVYEQREKDILNFFAQQKDKALGRMIEIAHDIDALQKQSNEELAEIHQKKQELEATQDAKQDGL